MKEIVQRVGKTIAFRVLVLALLGSVVTIIFMQLRPTQPFLKRSFQFLHITKTLYQQGADKFQQSDNYKGGLEEFTQELELNSNNAAGFLSRGSSRLMVEKYQEAVDNFNQAIKIDPNNSTAYLNRGVARFSLKDLQGAFNDFDEALRLNPNCAEAYTVRGGIHLQLGEQQNALEDFNQALQLNRTDASAYVGRGIIRSRVGDKSGAVTDYHRAAELFAASGDLTKYQQMQNTLKKLQ